MKNIFLPILLGLIAAVIDCAPMIAKKLDKLFIISAFLFWVVLGFFMPRIDIGLPFWLKGPVVSILFLMPTISLIYKVDKPAVPIVVITTVILGTLLGVASHWLLQ
ncbi:MAG: hypothetical protein GY754_01210 [bacterium]|nr:hypothetical protein [bacterium]